MDPLVAAAVLAAALLHASWHALVKCAAAIAVMAGIGVIAHGR
jgi:hypothetical protein